MRKAIKLKAVLWLEGEAEPASDFAAATMKAVRDIIAAGRKRHPELRITIKRLVEDEGGDDDDGGNDDGDDDAREQTYKPRAQ